MWMAVEKGLPSGLEGRVTFILDRLESSTLSQTPGEPPSHAKLAGPFAQPSKLSPTL